MMTLFHYSKSLEINEKMYKNVLIKTPRPARSLKVNLE